MFSFIRTVFTLQENCVCFIGTVFSFVWARVRGGGCCAHIAEHCRRTNPWPVVTDWPWCLSLGCPRNEKKQFSVRTETNRNKICFAFVSVCFVKPKKNFFRFVSVFRTFIETTETKRTVSKRTETIRNFMKNTLIKDIIRFCWSLYCYFYNCTVQQTFI